jgi:HAD superfamily hydrolase (TIGR01509 family)
VLFDAGGTLVSVHLERLAAELRARRHEPEELDVSFWRTLVLLDSEFSPGQEGWGDWFPRWLDRWALTCGIPPADLRAAWEAADRDTSLWGAVLPGVTECLTRLRDAGIRLGVVSNADGRIAESLGRAGLAGFFDVIIDSTIAGVAKPDPRIFALALAELGTAPEATWYVGDTVAYDAAAADAAGLVSWVVDHEGLHTVPHPRRVRTLAAVADAALAASR